MARSAPRELLAITRARCKIAPDMVERVGPVLPPQPVPPVHPGSCYIKTCPEGHKTDCGHTLAVYPSVIDIPSSDCPECQKEPK